MPHSIEGFRYVECNNTRLTVIFDCSVPHVSDVGQEITRRPMLTEAILAIIYNIIVVQVFQELCINGSLHDLRHDAEKSHRSIIAGIGFFTFLRNGLHAVNLLCSGKHTSLIRYLEELAKNRCTLSGIAFKNNSWNLVRACSFTRIQFLEDAFYGVEI